MDAEQEIRANTQRSLTLLASATEILLQMLVAGPSEIPEVADKIVASRLGLPEGPAYTSSPEAIQALLRPGEAILTHPPARPGGLWRGQLVLRRTAPGVGGARPIVEPMGIEVFSTTEGGAAAAALAAGRQAQAATLAAMIDAVPCLAAGADLTTATLRMPRAREAA